MSKARIGLQSLAMGLMVATPCAIAVLLSFPMFTSERAALQRENSLWRAKSLAFEVADYLQVQRVKGEWNVPSKDAVIDSGITRLPLTDEVFGYVSNDNKLVLLSANAENQIVMRPGELQKPIESYGPRAGVLDSHGVPVGLSGAVLNADQFKQIAAQQQRDGSLAIEGEWVAYHEIPKTNMIAVVTTPQKTLQFSYEKRAVLVALIGLVFAITAALTAGYWTSTQRKES